MTHTPKHTPDESIFKDREKEAAFWDTHFDEAFEQGTPVQVQFAKNLSEGITIRLDLDTLTKLRAEAHKKGIGPTTLARMWILERLEKSENRHSPKPSR